MSGVVEYLQKRASSTFLVSVTIFWCILNWQGLYATFFVDQKYIYDRFGVTKDKYIEDNFFGWRPKEYDYLGDWVLVVKPAKFALSVLFAWVYVWWLPKWVLNKAYEKDIDYKYERKMMKIKKEHELTLGQKKISEEKLDIIKTEAETEKIKKDVFSNKRKWSLEFEAVCNRSDFGNIMNLLKDVSYGGVFYSNISPDDRMIIDLWDLYDKDEATITGKGKFFLNKYISARG